MADVAEAAEANKKLELLLTEVNQLIEHLDVNFPESASSDEFRGARDRSSRTGTDRLSSPRPRIQEIRPPARRSNLLGGLVLRLDEPSSVIDTNCYFRPQHCCC
jgi:hypothetical protein